VGGAQLGIGGVLILLVLSLIFGQDLFALLGVAPGAPVTTGTRPPVSNAIEEQLVDFVSFVLDDTQALWSELTPRLGVPYRDAVLVLFRDSTTSACGFASAATGPFYCPPDERVYIDLGFYDQLRSRYGAPGDFAQAYVIAHEIGHHVQTVLGIASDVRQAQAQRPALANRLSVAMELQADCFAGVWARSTDQRGLLERGDLEEGLAAAAAVGDDRLQRQAGGRVNPESFTHGSSAERTEWFGQGFRTGDPAQCDTFEAAGF
jgi:predicted metalloprotease